MTHDSQLEPQDTAAAHAPDSSGEDIPQKSTDHTSTGVAIGMVLGVALAIALNNWAYLGIGLAIGVAIGASWDDQN